MAGIKPPPHGKWVGNDTKPIFFDSIDNSAWILGKARHSARNAWIYIDGEAFMGARVDVAGDPKNPDLKIAWKYLYTSKDTWLGSEQNLGAQGAVYNLSMDPYEKYDMLFNGAVPMRQMSNSPGKWSGEDNGWVLAIVQAVIIDFDKSIIKYRNIKRQPGGDSNDLVPNLKHPENPVPSLNPANPPKAKGGGG